MGLPVVYNTLAAYSYRQQGAFWGPSQHDARQWDTIMSFIHQNSKDCMASATPLNLTGIFSLTAVLTTIS